MADLETRKPITESGSPIPGSQFEGEQQKIKTAEEEALEQAIAKAEPIQSDLRAVDQDFTMGKDFVSEVQKIKPEPSPLFQAESPQAQRELLAKILHGDAKDVISGAKVVDSAERIQDLVNNSQSDSTEQSPEQIH